MASFWTIIVLGMAATFFVSLAESQDDRGMNDTNSQPQEGKCSTNSRLNTVPSQVSTVPSNATDDCNTNFSQGFTISSQGSASLPSVQTTSIPLQSNTASSLSSTTMLLSVTSFYSPTTIMESSSSILTPLQTTMVIQTIRDTRKDSSSFQLLMPTVEKEATTSLLTPSASTTVTGALDSATIIGIAVGGAASLIAFALMILIVGVCCFCRGKVKSGSHSFSHSQGMTGDARMYETPTDILSGSNGVIENPATYATPGEVRYVKHADVVQTPDNNAATSSLQKDLGQNLGDTAANAEPQMYEVAVSMNSHSQPETETPMYEEPRDSILHFRQSIEADETEQQPYEVPIRTSFREDQSPPFRASTSGQDINPLNRTLSSPRTTSDPQPCPPTNRTLSSSFPDTLSPYAEPVITSVNNTSDEIDHYSVVDKNQPSKQETDQNEPVYFELENQQQGTDSVHPKASENVYAELEKKSANENKKDHSDLQCNGSEATEERHQEKDISSGPDEHAYFVLERK